MSVSIFNSYHINSNQLEPIKYSDLILILAISRLNEFKESYPQDESIGSKHFADFYCHKFPIIFRK